MSQGPSRQAVGHAHYEPTAWLRGTENELRVRWDTSPAESTTPGRPGSYGELLVGHYNRTANL